jgi:hypothetical protein
MGKQQAQEQVLTVTAENRELNVAPGSVVHVRDEEWLVTSLEKSVDGTLVRVQGLSELVRDTYRRLLLRSGHIQVVDPAKSKVVADDTPNYRRAASSSRPRSARRRRPSPPNT